MDKSLAAAAVGPAGAAVFVEKNEVRDRLKSVQRVLVEDKPEQPDAVMSTARPGNECDITL